MPTIIVRAESFEGFVWVLGIIFKSSILIMVKVKNKPCLQTFLPASVFGKGNNLHVLKHKLTSMKQDLSFS